MVEATYSSETGWMYSETDFPKGGQKARIPSTDKRVDYTVGTAYGSGHTDRIPDIAVFFPLRFMGKTQAYLRIGPDKKGSQPSLLLHAVRQDGGPGEMKGFVAVPDMQMAKRTTFCGLIELAVAHIIRHPDLFLDVVSIPRDMEAF